MESLKRLALDIGGYEVRLSPQKTIVIATLTIRFQRATKGQFRRSTPETYTVKPLVEVDGEPLFGELAVLRWLQKDGWDGVWVDTYHGDRLFWKGLPDRTAPAILPPKATALYDRIVEVNGRRAGFFDVFAWRGREFLFVEYKGKGDSIKPNQLSWIKSAIKAGVPVSSLVLVVH
ncbi:MAG: VRR-NUC domain-containing protein [Verrucomicrobiia bacterium]